MKQALEYLKKLKVLVAVPSHGSWEADFGMSLANMLAAASMKKIGNYRDQEIQVMNIKGSILPKSRRLAVEEAMKLDADYLLFIDSDQTFPRTLLHGLIKHQVDCVAANIATKQIPATPTARRKDPYGDPTKWITVYTDENSRGLERVDRIGAGIMLLSRKAYSVLKPGSFNMYWREDVQTEQGEDWSMCDVLEKAGIEIYIDHALSNLVGHVGRFTYTMEVVGEVRDVRHSESRAA